MYITLIQGNNLPLWVQTGYLTLLATYRSIQLSLCTCVYCNRFVPASSSWYLCRLNTWSDQWLGHLWPAVLFMENNWIHHKKKKKEGEQAPSKVGCAIVGTKLGNAFWSIGLHRGNCKPAVSAPVLYLSRWLMQCFMSYAIKWRWWDHFLLALLEDTEINALKIIPIWPFRRLYWGVTQHVLMLN